MLELKVGQTFQKIGQKQQLQFSLKKWHFKKYAQKCHQIFGLLLYENWLQRTFKIAQSGHTS